ncbi:hypothetical protein [Plantactinospora sp. KLBMP9567]|uniref:hypothetical protein n=1 Tax=Plantactinospora sp. KLBMP9567 TaxID=3085900 RepID=UPI002982543E|nr:hypothetical protein [Plantactinospora sp. KLBMP9567]MDW5327142.1 hypothetical protein [Plantactinospora sp. KLBMP9567]
MPPADLGASDGGEELKVTVGEPAMGRWQAALELDPEPVVVVSGEGRHDERRSPGDN